MRKFSFLLRNVSFRAITSISFSFRYNSSSLRFGLIPWQFQNRMFKPMKLIRGYLSWMIMRYSGLVGCFRLFGDSLSGVVLVVEVELCLLEKWILVWRMVLR